MLKVGTVKGLVLLTSCHEATDRLKKDLVFLISQTPHSLYELNSQLECLLKKQTQTLLLGELLMLLFICYLQVVGATGLVFW